MNRMFEPCWLAPVHLSKREVLATVPWSSTSEDVSNTVGHNRRSVCLRLPAGAGVPVTSPRLYSAGHTDDTRNALAFISQQFPKARLLGVGFSLGSNVLTRYLGEEGEATRLHSACVLACVREFRSLPIHEFAHFSASEAMEPTAQ